MNKYKIWKFGLAVALALTLGLAGCGGGGGDVAANPDTDGDGIPNAVDALPNDATRFVDNVTVQLTGLTPPAASFSAATAVNNSGKVVGYSQDAAAIKAVRWAVNATTGTTGATETLNPLAGAANTYSAAYAINNAGVTVGETESGANIFVAASWAADGTTATALPLTGAAAPAAAYGINNAATAQIVGEAMFGGRQHAVLWNSATAAPVDLGILPGGTFSAAYAINDNGLVVGEADIAGGATHAVAWSVSAAGVKTLGPIDLGVITVADAASVAFDIDNSGRVVGESEDQAGVAHAGMWTLNSTLQPAEKTDLGANGSASAINNTNRIAGHLGATSLATVWDTQKTTLPNSAVVETAFSQATGLNDSNLVVGVQGTRAFVALPKK